MRTNVAWALQQLSKGYKSKETVVQETFVPDTVVQGDSCPMGLLSKEALTNEMLAQINFSDFLLEVTIFIDSLGNKIKKRKVVWNISLY